MSVKIWHRWNGVFLFGFIVLHFATHLAGVFGIEAYNATQDALRLVYRNVLVEPFVLASAVGQIVLGGWLLVRRVRAGLRGRWARVQVWSGGVLLFFLTEHLIALVLARWVDGLDTNFYWPASVMRGAPFTLYFVPYYFLGVASLFVHLGCASRLMLMRGAYRRFAGVSFWVFSVLGVWMAGVIVWTLLGGFYEIELPQEWVAYLQRFVAGYAP